MISLLLAPIHWLLFIVMILASPSAMVLEPFSTDPAFIRGLPSDAVRVTNPTLVEQLLRKGLTSPTDPGALLVTEDGELHIDDGCNHGNSFGMNVRPNGQIAALGSSFTEKWCGDENYAVSTALRSFPLTLYRLGDTYYVVGDARAVAMRPRST